MLPRAHIQFWEYSKIKTRRTKGSKNSFGSLLAYMSQSMIIITTLYTQWGVFILSQHPNKHRHLLSKAATYFEDEADGGHAGGGHDFGSVGDQAEEGRHDGLCPVVEPTAEHQRQVAGDGRAGQTLRLAGLHEQLAHCVTLNNNKQTNSFILMLIMQDKNIKYKKGIEMSF